jgi:hypothetical protein
MITHSRLDQINKVFQAMVDDNNTREREMWIIMSGILLLEKIRLKQDFDEAMAFDEINIIFMGVLALVKLYQNQMPVQLKTEKKKSDQTRYPNVDNVIVALGQQIMHEDWPFNFTAMATTYPVLLQEINDIHSILNKELIVPARPPQPILEHRKDKLGFQTFEEMQYEVLNGSTWELDLLKQDLKDIFAMYLKPYTFKFFCFGPNHKNRAKAIFAAIQQAPDIETIKEIIDIQQYFMSSLYCLETPRQTVEELETKTGLTERWSTLRNLKNQPKDFDHPQKSGYYRTLCFAMGRVIGPKIAETAGPNDPLYQGPSPQKMR